MSGAAISGLSHFHLDEKPQQTRKDQFWISMPVLIDLLAHVAGCLLLSGILEASRIYDSLDSTEGAIDDSDNDSNDPRTPKGKRRITLNSGTWSSSSDDRWKEKVMELADRGFTLEALLEFYDGLGRDYMPQYNPNVHTTADVVRQAIIPLSAPHQCAYASVMMDFQPVQPQRMVTHNWGNLFRDLIAAICADALGFCEHSPMCKFLDQNLPELKEMLERTGHLQTTYWVCAFSVCQHSCICGANPKGDKDPVTGQVHPTCPCSMPKSFNKDAPLDGEGRSIACEMNKFDDMMSYLSVASEVQFRQLIAVDEKFELFSRAWCVAEIAEAFTMGMRQTLSIKRGDLLDVHEQRLRSLRVEEMQASRPEDVAEILAKIPDKASFNDQLQELIFHEGSGLFSKWRGLDALQRLEMVGDLVRAKAGERDDDGNGFYADFLDAAAESGVECLKSTARKARGKNKEDDPEQGEEDEEEDEDEDEDGVNMNNFSEQLLHLGRGNIQVFDHLARLSSQTSKSLKQYDV
eukprot:TRINITY_DN21636_c1_g4_i2.p1 TRINITY_DN21636_c1_g4~~TRINITY_DN21636_c1_g4_i2.p1  ORF type:complete len:520 (+),score=90.04 TRINITY_DN21636_c1_g4_i2:391-1950(+)